MQGFHAAGRRDATLPWQQQVRSITSLLSKLQRQTGKAGSQEHSR